MSVDPMCPQPSFSLPPQVGPGKCGSNGLRPISLLKLPLLTLLDSNFQGIPYGPGNSTPEKYHCARVKPSEIHNVSREIGRS